MAIRFRIDSGERETDKAKNSVFAWVLSNMQEPKQLKQAITDTEKNIELTKP